MNVFEDQIQEEVELTGNQDEYEDFDDEDYIECILHELDEILENAEREAEEYERVIVELDEIAYQEYVRDLDVSDNDEGYESYETEEEDSDSEDY